MSDNIDSITVRTAEHKCNHGSLDKNRWYFASSKRYHIYSSTTPSSSETAHGASHGRAFAVPEERRPRTSAPPNHSTRQLILPYCPPTFR